MARKGGDKTRCNGLWTEAKYKAFIKGNLRNATRKWAPITSTLADAKVARGIYHCEGCGNDVPLTSKDDSGKRRKNILVDHIIPVVDPYVGWTNWDDVINRMFCEKDNLQVLCYDCHKVKSDEEKAIAKARRDKAKEGNLEEDD